MVRTLSFHCMHACACVCVCVCVCVCRAGGGVHGSSPVWELRYCETQPKKKSLSLGWRDHGKRLRNCFIVTRASFVTVISLYYTVYLLLLLLSHFSATP